MARVPLTAIIIFLALAANPVNSASGAVVYRGGGDGVRVRLKVKGNRIVRARVATTLRCVQGLGRHHEERLVHYWTTRAHHVPGDLTAATLSAIPIRADGSFLEELDHSEPDGIQEETFAGVVRRGAVTGRYRFFSWYEGACGTGPFQSLRRRREAKEVLHFRAVRRSYPRSSRELSIP